MTKLNMNMEGVQTDIKVLQEASKDLHKMIDSFNITEIKSDIKILRADSQSLLKMMATFNMTEITEDFKGLRANKQHLLQKMDGLHTEVKDLRNLFVSSQKGQSAAANSALSIHLDGHHFACGTLAYSARLKEAVVLTSMHAVANLDPARLCPYNITVRARGNVEIPISRWYVPQGNANIAYGRLAQPPPIPALNITSSADVLPGLHIWGFALQESALVALDGRVTWALESHHRLLTNVGEVPGCSGTGYVDYARTLSVVHVGAPPPELGIRPWPDADEATEQNPVFDSSGCLKGMQLGMTGMASHIDACLDLVSDIAAPVEARRRCMEGWSMLVGGNLAGPPPDFVSRCTSFFASRAIDDNTKRACELGWRNNCGQNCDFITQCLSFASGEALNDRVGQAMREECRAGWYGKYAEYARTCKRYIELRARNPQAEGVAAWVVDDPDFVFVDRLDRFPRQC